MSILSKIRGFVSRHRNKFVVGGVLITGTVLLTRYAQQKLKEWQEKEMREFLERTRKQQHFESTERTCNQTVLSLMTRLNESLALAIDTDDIVTRLRTNPENKVELWRELKVLVFTKVTCLIHMTVMLMIILRIQLNIVGGYLFKDPNSVPTEMQEKYLLLCNNLFDSGLANLVKVVKTECSKILEKVNLDKQMKLSDFDNIFWSIQCSISTGESNPVEHLVSYILPEGVPVDKDVYSSMVVYTADLLESDEVKGLVNHCISRSFSTMSDRLASYYMSGNPDSSKVPSTNDFVHPADIQIPLAKVIPVVNGLVSKGWLPEQTVNQLIVNDRLKTFGANIYECFSHSK